MKLDFLIDFDVKKGFLFSFEELSVILNAAKANEPFVKVKITNGNGKSVICMLPNNSKMIEIIKSEKKRPSDLSTPTQYAFWKETKIIIPSIPSQIKKRGGIEWYLYCNSNGFGVMHNSLITSHYLLAEISAETSDFVLTENCTIEIE